MLVAKCMGSGRVVAEKVMMWRSGGPPLLHTALRIINLLTKNFAGNYLGNIIHQHLPPPTKGRR